MKKYHWILGLGLSLMLSFPAISQEEQKPIFQPDITVDISEFQKRNYQYIGDLLALMPGVWIENSSVPGNWASAGLSGADARETTILMDGRPLGNAWSGATDLYLIPVEMIEKIDVYHSLNPFGVQAIGGVVNLVTQVVPTIRPYTRIVYRSEKGSFSDTDVTFGQKLSPTTEILSGLLLKRHGDFAVDERALDQQIIRSKIKYQLFAQVDLEYAVLFHKSDLDVAHPLTLPEVETAIAEPHRKRTRTDHRFKATLPAGDHPLHIQLDKSGMTFEIDNPEATEAHQIQISETALHLGQRLKVKKWDLNWGLHSRFRHLEGHAGNKGTDVNGQGFIQGTTHGSRFQNVLQAGFHVSSIGAPALLVSDQLSWTPSPKLQLWTAYADGVREPSLGERYGYPCFLTPLENPALLDQNHYAPNMNLKPEFSRTLNFGLRWNPASWLQATGRVYQRWTRDIILPEISEDEIQFINNGDLTASGLASQINVGPFLGFTTRIAFNWMYNNAETHYAPEAWTDAELAWRHNFFKDDLQARISISMRHNTSYWTADIPGSDPTPLQIQTDPILDLKVYLVILQHATLTYAIENLLDQVAYVSGYFPMPGSTTRIGLIWNLYD